MQGDVPRLKIGHSDSLSGAERREDGNIGLYARDKME